MQVIKDIKQKNFSVSQLGDLNSTLRSISAFSDMVIPTINGQKPIDFDILAGMDANVNDDFLEYLLKSMISGTGIPNAVIGVREEVEFAKSLSMVNGNFIKQTIRRQQEGAATYLELYKLLYQLHFPEDKLDTYFMTASFAPPTTLNLNNTLSVIGDAKNFAEQIAENLTFSNLPDDQREIAKSVFKSKYIRQKLPYVDWDEVDQLVSESLIEVREMKLKLNAAVPPQPAADTTGGAGDGGADGGFDDTAFS